jgi:hypothetical protein
MLLHLSLYPNDVIIIIIIITSSFPILRLLRPVTDIRNQNSPDVSQIFPNFLLLLVEIFQISFGILWELNMLTPSFKLILYFSMDRGNYTFLIQFLRVCDWTVMLFVILPNCFYLFVWGL